MRKTLCKLTGFLFLLSLMPLSACHGAKGLKAFEIPESFDTSQKYEITFWAKNDTNKAQTAIYEKAISDFEALYPNITVNMRLYTDYGKIYNDVITNIATNTTPDVCITYPDHIATYLTGANIVVPLDDLFVDPKFGFGGSEVKFDSPMQSEIVPSYLEEGAFKDHYYAVPFMRSTEALYINKTYVENLGFEIPDEITWDFVWEVSDAAMEKDAEGNFKINGQKVMIPFIYKSTDNMMIQLLHQKEAPFSTKDGDILVFNDTTKDILREIAEHTKNGSFSTFKISSYPANFLNAGQCIFAIDSTAGSTWMGSEAPLLDISEDKLVRFETLVRPIPQCDWENPSMISQGPSICVFNKENPNQVVASWLFTQYLLTNDVQIAYSETEGYVPVTTKARETKEYRDYLSRGGEDKTTYYSVKIDATKMLIDYTDSTFVTPVFNGSASLRDASGQMIENTVKAIRRGQTVEEDFYDTLFFDMKSLYHMDRIGASVSDGEKKAFDALPAGSVALLISLALTWVLIVLYVVISYIKTRKNRSNS